MENENCERLFQYLKSILYDRPIPSFDPDTLDEPYRKLGQGLAVLQQQVEELLSFSADISQGNLSGTVPSRDNFLCANMKNLHANLNHLTWQAKQVAAGDYSQKVSYLGDFSEAFNTMTEQLKERENLLMQRARIASHYNELLVEIINKSYGWILAVDAQTREIVYCNKSRDRVDTHAAECTICQDRLFFLDQILEKTDYKQHEVWEMGDDDHGFYRIITFLTEWDGRATYIHIVDDVTNEKIMENKLTSKAYFDALTGIRNRLSFKEYMEAMLEKRDSVTLCYLDLDGLKFVNDRYGHNEGDEYLRRFVSAIECSFRYSDIFARLGGDEFCLILPVRDKNAVERRLNEVLEGFVKDNDKDYPVSFSYGVVFIDGEKNTLSLQEIISQADGAMYQHKKINKEKYHHEK